MPRRARIFQRALCYHVMNRRLNGLPVFHDEADYERFGELVRDYKEICGAKVYHWTWMGNHYHMLIEVVYDNLRPFLGGIQQTYVRHYYSRHGGGGLFWKGRFKSKPVEIGGYLGSCGRYIERNAVRAGIVTEPWAYKWTSAAHYVKCAADGITDTNHYLGKMEEQDRKIYGEVLMAGVDDSLMKQRNKSAVLGSPEFGAKLRLDHGRFRLKRGKPVESV